MMSLNKLSLGGNNLYMTSLFLIRESLVSDIPAGNGNIEKLFLQCTILQKVALDCLSYHATANDEDAIWLSKEIIPKVS
jgi:hypothetical protein